MSVSEQFHVASCIIFTWFLTKALFFWWQLWFDAFWHCFSAQLSSGQRAEAARRGSKMHTRTHTQTHSLFSCDKRSMCNHVQSAHRCTETPSLKKSICGYIDHCWGLLMGHMGKQRGKSCLKLGLLLLVYFCMVGTWQYTDGRYDKIHDITREGKRKGKNKYHLKKKKHYLHLNIQWSLFLAIFCPLGDLYAN